MPVILDPADYDMWLRGTTGEAQALLHPYRGAITAYRVSTRVNSVRNDDEAILEPVEALVAEEKTQLDLL
jgi:putative SOS response-associated peptidase YedK